MTDKELYERCVFVGKQARKWKNEFVALLPEVARRELHKKHGFATVVEFAAKIGGVGRGTVEKVFQVEKYVSDKPELKKLIPKVGVNKVRIVATMATQENQVELAERVRTMSKGALELFAREQRAPEISSPGTGRTMVSFSLDKATEFKLRKFKNNMGGVVEWNDVIKKLLEVAEAQVARPKKVHKERKIEMPTKIARYVPVSVRHELPEKCQYPGCGRPAQVIHHPHRFALQANHENLKPLCKGHHELVHQGFEPSQWHPKTHPSIEKKFVSLITRSNSGSMAQRKYVN
ncbi:hypothetical protein C0416_05530 [bacterium]|nr:hypothetical protein [bacterium]